MEKKYFDIQVMRLSLSQFKEKDALHSLLFSPQTLLFLICVEGRTHNSHKKELKLSSCCFFFLKIQISE